MNIFWEALLDDLEDYLEDRQDIQDGDYGVPAANIEMALLARLRELREPSR